MEFGIGGTQKQDDSGGDGFAALSQNRTMFVQKLTDEESFQPQLVEDLKSVEDVFGFFKPNKKVEFADEQGVPVEEELRFGNLGDFGSKGITKQSKYLQDVSNKQEQYLKVVKDLKSNKALQSVVQNPETREAFVTAIRAMLKELEDAGV